MNLAACAQLTTRPEHLVWFRAIQSQHLQTALATSHTTSIASRFSTANVSAAAYPLLYLAENHQVALFEVGALLGSPYGQVIANPHLTWTILNVAVTLQAVADLTDPAEEARLGTKAQELTGDWEGYQRRQGSTSVKGPTGHAPTQLLGEALSQVPGLEGFRTLSAPVPIHMNLVIFPDKLRPGSGILFTDPATGLSHAITLTPTRRRRRS